MAQNKKGGMSAGGIFLCIIIVIAATFAGYKMAVDFANKKLTENGITSANINGTTKTNEIGSAVGNTGGTTGAGTGTTTSLNMTPVNLVFAVNSETGRIETVLIEILRCYENKLDYIYLAPEITYTMTTDLYARLIPDNTELPQTVTLSELYRYYHNDKAYEAARQIISELINFNVLYYTTVTDDELSEFISISDNPEGFGMKFVLSSAEAKNGFSTEGSVKGAIEEALKNAFTNWSVSDRLRYLEIYDALEADSVNFYKAPVKELNESCELDAYGTGTILYGILY